MILVCTVALMLNVGGVGIESREDVQGVVRGQGPTKYLMDFSEGVKKFKLFDKASKYEYKIVNKDDCVKPN